MIALRKDNSVMPADTSRPFLAFAGDEATADIIRRVCESEGMSIDNVINADLLGAIESLSDIRTPPLLIIDLGGASNVMEAAERLSEVCDADARVILLGEVNDLHVYRDVISAGVADYIVKPFTDNDLSESLERSRPRPVAEIKPIEQTVSVGTAVSTAVIGVRGGVGASTIAANAAWHLSHEVAKNVTLIDMDLTFGTQALMLDVDPGAGLGDAMREPDRMDELFVKRASVKLDDHLRVMASETDPSRGDIASAGAFSGLLEFVEVDMDVVIVDVPRTLAVAQPEILVPFSRIVLVAEPTLAAMRDVARLSTLVKSTNPTAIISVVLNRQGIASKEELTQKTFEEGSGLNVDLKIPFDPKTAFSAEASGKCVLATSPRSKMGRALTGVARSVAGIEDTPKKPVFGFLKRPSKTTSVDE